MPNVLPQNEQHRIRKERTLRFAVVSVFGLFILVLIAGVLLIPSYILSRAEEQSLTQRLEALRTLTARQENTDSGHIITQLKQQLDTLAHTSPSALDRLETILELSREGITLTGFLYTTDGMQTKVTLQGVAKTRDQLLGFRDVLLKEQSIADVTLPVASLAESTNITFSLPVVFQSESENT